MTLKIASVLIMLALAGCGATEKPRAKPPLTVGVDTAAVTSFAPRLNVLGTVQPLQSVAVRTRVDGQIVAVLFHEGANVRAGQPLFRLDDRAVRAQIAQNRAALASAIATNAQAVADFKRSEALVSSGFVSKATIEIKQAAAATSSAGIGSARAALSAAETQLSYLVIAAPVSGRTGEIGYKLGATVRAADTVPLVTVNQLSPIQVRFAVPPEQIQPLRAAQAAGGVGITARTHGSAVPLAMGKLVFLDNNVDPGTGSLAAKAEFTNGGDTLWPGALVDLDVPLGAAVRLVSVPEAAVQAGSDATYVWTLGDHSKVGLTKVTVAGRQGGRVFIASGLAPGSRIVVDALAKLRPGDIVSPKLVPPALASAA